MRNARHAEVTLAPWIWKSVTNVWEQTNIENTCTGHREECAALGATLTNGEELTSAENALLEVLHLFCQWYGCVGSFPVLLLYSFLDEM